MNLAYVVWNADPVLFTLGPLQVRWYGLFWAIGFLVGYMILGKMFKREGISDKELDKLTLSMIIFTVIGARLGHCLFYEPEYFLAHPIEMLKIWGGGLASHGGAIGILIGLFIYCKRNKRSYVWILDRIVVPVSFVGCLIRLGNLMNSEIYGTPTSLPWGFVFLRGNEQFCGTFDSYYQCTAFNCCPQTEWLPCHPTQIYEALYCIVALVLLLWLYYKKDMGTRRPGFMFGLFLIIIFGTRIAIEFIKNVQVDFETQMTGNMGQWLSLPFVVVGIAFIVLSLLGVTKPKK